MADLSQRVPLGIDESKYTLAQLQSAYNKAHAAQDGDVANQLQEMVNRKVQTMRETAAGNMGFGEQVARSYGQTMPRMAEGIANWAGAKGKFHIPGVGTFDSTDPGLTAEDKANEELGKTAGGTVGNVLAQTVATLPLGMGAGAAIRGGGALAGRFAPQILKYAAQVAETNPAKAKVLMNALGIGGAAGQGAVQSGAMAAPGQQTEAAKSGAELNALLGAGTQAGGRVLSGVVQKSPAAQMLIDEAKKAGQAVFLPISRAAGEGGLSGLMGSIYRGVMPLGATVEGRFEKQTQRAIKDTQQARENIWEGERQQALSASAEQQAGYKDTFDNYTFPLPFDYKGQVDRALAKAHPNMPAEDRARLVNIMDRNLSQIGSQGEWGAELSGANLRRGLSQASDQIDKLGVDPSWKESSLQTGRDIVQQAIDEHHDILSKSDNPKEIQGAQQFLTDMGNYQALSKKDAEVAGMMKNIEGGPPNLTESFSEAAQKERRGSPAYPLLRSAQDVFESEEPSGKYPEVAQLGKQLLRYGLPAGTLYGGMHQGMGNVGLGLTLAGEGLTNLGSTKTAQNLLYGDLGPQQALANYLRRDPTGAFALGQPGSAGPQAFAQALRAGYTADEDQPQVPRENY